MRTPEGIEKDKIKKYLTMRGAWYFCPFMAGRGASGVPDIIVCMSGRFVAIEVKRPGKRPTFLQIRCLMNIDKSNGTAIWGDAKKIIPLLDLL